MPAHIRIAASWNGPYRCVWLTTWVPLCRVPRVSVCASQHCVLIASARVGWLHRQSVRCSASSVYTWMTDYAWCRMAVLTTAQPIKSNIGGPPGMLPLVTPFTYRFNFNVNLTRKKPMCAILTCTCTTELSIKSKFEAGNSIFSFFFGNFRLMVGEKKPPEAFKMFCSGTL